MAKDFDASNDMGPDIGNDAIGITGSDCSGDLASGDGVDLNADEVSKTEGLAKATLMSCDVPPLPTTSDEIRQINEGMGEGPDHRGIENQAPRKPEYGDYPPDEQLLEQIQEQYPDFEISLPRDRNE